MNDKNRVFRAQCFRPVRPASTRGLSGDELWSLISPQSGLFFTQLDAEAEIYLRSHRPCYLRQPTYRAWALENSLESQEQIIEVKFGDTAFCDFGDITTREPYDPLQDENLWQNFIESRPYESKAHKLFRKYGHLLEPTSDEVRRIEHLSAMGIKVLYAENMQSWHAERKRLFFAYDLWKIMSNEEYDTPKKLSLLSEEVINFYSYDDIGHWDGFAKFADTLFNFESSLPQNSIGRWHEFQRAVKALDYNSYCLLLSDLVSFGIGNLKVSIDVHSSGKVTQVFSPKNLAAAVWLQFSQRMSEGEKLRICQQCNQPFAILRTQHSDKTFCSNACKQKAWRNSPEQRAKRRKRDQP